MGCVYAYVILLTFLGPEHRGRQFGVAHDSDLAEATGPDAMAAVINRREIMGNESSDDGEEKKMERGIERV